MVSAVVLLDPAVYNGNQCIATKGKPRDDDGSAGFSGVDLE